MNGASSRPWFVYALAVAVVVAGAYLAFELGRFQAGYSLIDQRRSMAGLQEQIDSERAASDELRRQLAIFETGKEIDRETYAQVEANLADLQTKIQTQEEELVFYRGIVSPQDGVAGLRIQNFEALAADGENRFLVRLVLVQAIVHSRKITGEVKLEIEGAQDGKPASFDVKDLVADRGDYDMGYDFRYFQGLEAEIVLPTGFEPARVNVEIRPREARAVKVNESYEWSAITDKPGPSDLSGSIR